MLSSVVERFSVLSSVKCCVIERFRALSSVVERCRVLPSVVECCRALSSVVERFPVLSNVKCCVVERFRVFSSVFERCRALSSVVESNLIKVKIVKRQCLTLILFEVLSSVVESVWPSNRLYSRFSAQKFRAYACVEDRKVKGRMKVE